MSATFFNMRRRKRALATKKAKESATVPNVKEAEVKPKKKGGGKDGK